MAWPWPEAAPQLMLVEARGGLRVPRDSVLLSCCGSGFTRHLDIWWYRQAPGGKLEWMSISSYSGTTKKYAAAFQGRAMVSQNNSWSETPLSLHALCPWDSACYFCAIPMRTGNAAEH
uniref:Ig-like domain-containing protein n=1 Tax=Bubo bubo TaxID=30461 RepID=A0A8C0F150_BUBBB